MIASSDNYERWESHERQKEKELERLPVCEICGIPIQDEHCYLINDEFVCQRCLDRDFRKWTDDFAS